jgi:hypothetical protein
MGVFEQFPYTNFHELNLDWILNTIKKMQYDFTTFISQNAIKYSDPIQWNITTQYEKNTVVVDVSGNGYLSVQAVPGGISIDREEYWTVIGNFSALWGGVKNGITSEDEGHSVTATKVRVIGDLVWLNNDLIEVTVNMNAGNAYVIGSNCRIYSMQILLEELETAILNEVNARTNADTALQEDIDAEVLARTNADTALDNAIDAEVLARTNADTALDNAIDAEVLARTNADTALDNAIDAEVLARTNADTALDQAIDAEVLARTNADTALDNAIDAEAIARTNADTALQEDIDNSATKVNNLKIVNVKDLGAIGDGNHDDTTAIQSAIDSIETSRGCVYFPNGHYYISDSIKLPSFVTLKGESMSGVVIDNQYLLLAKPQLVNKSSEYLIFVTIEDITFRGGTDGIKINITNETAGNKFINVTFELQTASNIRINKLMQTSIFQNCNFNDSPYGIMVDAFTSNANNFINCSFTNHEWAHVYLRVSEVNNFIGCRFENGGQLEKATIDVTNAKNLKFDGCYFERTHTYVINEVDSSNSVTFNDCHFTGASDGVTGIAEYKFNSDGFINFTGNNTWTVRSNGSTKMLINGQNNNMLGNNNHLIISDTKQYKNLVSPYIVCPVTLQKDLISFDRVNSSASVTNIQMITGILTINYFSLEAGGFQVDFSRRYHIKVLGNGDNVINSNAVLISQSDTIRDTSEITIRGKEGATINHLTLEAVLIGVNPLSQMASALQYSFEYTGLSTLEKDTILAKLL